MRLGKVLHPAMENSSPKPENYSFESLQLRDLQDAISSKEEPRKAKDKGKKSIAIISGKGGVGKSSFALNLSLLVGGKFRRSVALIDADLGCANADVLLGLDTRLNLNHVIKGELSLKEIILPVSDKVWLVPGGNGISGLAEMNEKTKASLMPQIMALDEMVDIIVIDTGAGISPTVRDFAMAADAVVLVTTPEPTAQKDAYSMIKSLSLYYGNERLEEKELYVMVNMAFSKEEARLSAKRLIQASDHFLGLHLDFLGFLPYDLKVPKAVKSRCPLVKLYPGSDLAARIGHMTGRLLCEPESESARQDKDVNKGPMAKLLSAMTGWRRSKRDRP